MRKATIHSVRLTTLHDLVSHTQALDTARERFSDRYTGVDSAHCLETCTMLRTFREATRRWIDARAPGTDYATLIEAHSLDEKTTDCLLRIQAFQEDYRQLRTYPRLQEQRRIYTEISRLIEGIEKIEAQASEARHEGGPTDDEDDSEREDPDV